jgi:glycine cleavage system aminomethyltransferase T
MIDLTGFVKFDVTGPGALGLVERLAVKKLDRPVGTVVYTPLLNADAGIKCDLTITRLDESRFRVITGGGMGTHDIAWFRRHCPTDGSVNIQDVTSGLCCIGVWGPLARALVQSVCEWDLSNNAFPFGTAKHVAVGEVPALLVRISYVGELGWEIYAPPDLGAKLWDTLWDAGREQGVVAVGIASYGSSLRLEKGYRFWGQDIHTGFNPFEAGLLRDVSLGEPTPIKRTDFIGREALLRIRGEGVARRLSCMTFDEPGVVSMGYEPILHGGRVLGYVTSAEYGYSIDRGIAYGYLPVSHADVGASVEIEYLGKRYPATVQQEPLYDSDDAKLKS